MAGRLILFIIVHLVALVYFVEMLRRVAKRSKEYDLKEDSRTLPFGFVRLRYVVIAYAVGYAIWFVASIWLYILFVNPSAVSPGVLLKTFELNL